MCPSQNVEETKKKEEEGPLQRVINSFLAAMSSSRSDVVTQFVFPFVRPFIPFFSFSVLWVCSAFSMLFQESLKDVFKLNDVQGCFKEVFGCLQKVPRVFWKSLKGVSRKFQECFKEDWRVFQWSFKRVSRVFRRSSNMCLRKVS